MMKANYFDKKNFMLTCTQTHFIKYGGRAAAAGIFFMMKKSKRLSAAIVLLSFIIPCFTSAQVTYEANQWWKWLHPNAQGNNLRWCKMWNKDLFYMAGGGSTFLKTTDGGVTWYLNYSYGRRTGITSNGQRPDVYDAHFFNQNTGIMIGNYGSVCRTTNAGVSFDSIPGLIIGNGTSTDIWYKTYFLNNNTGYIAGSQGKLVKTTNGGNNWTVITSISTATHYDVWTPNDTLVIVSSAGGNIQRSTNSGQNWSTISTGPSSTLQRICFVNRDTGFVCGSAGAVRLTTNSGLNWVSVTTGVPVNTYFDLDYKMTGQTTEVYLTGNPNYIYKTTTFGSSWDTVGFRPQGQNYQGSFQVYLATNLGTGDTLLTVGAFSLANKRNSSSECLLLANYLKFGPATVYDIAALNNKIWAVGSPTGRNSLGGPMDDQIIFSSNGGSSWVKQNSGSINGNYLGISMLNENTGYVVGSTGRILKTINGGATWDSLISPTSNNLVYVKFLNVNTGWVSGSDIYKTTNGGLNWVQQPGPAGGTIYCVDMQDMNTGWLSGASATESFVYKTTNSGANWVQQNHNLSTARNIYNIKMTDMNTGYFAGYMNFQKTTNGGANWDSVPLPFSSGVYQINGMDFINSQVGMLLFDFTTLKTTDGGTSWVIDYTGSISGVTDFALFPSRLRMVHRDTAYTGGSLASVLKYSPPSLVGITQWTNNNPKEFKLFQNYPNPFNPSTTIKFAIHKQSAVTLKVYDVTGRLVSTVMDNLSLNAGTVTHNFDGSALASGIYFYSLYINGDFMAGKKMILIK